MRTGLFLYLAVMSATVSQADDALYTSTNAVARIDTSGSPYAVVSADEGATVTYRRGESVSVIMPDGSISRLVDEQAASGVAAWLPEAGGVYILTNSVSGAATFTVRYSDFGTQGSGTIDDPVKIMDDAEIADLAASGDLGDGMFVSLRGPSVSIGGSSRPSGLSVQYVGEGLYEMLSDYTGKCYAGRPVSSVMETIRPGPHRKINLRDMLAVAYSGDKWIGNPNAQSLLKIESPSGIVDEGVYEGSGAIPFCPTEKGVWKIVLTVGDCELQSSVSVVPRQFAIVIR